MLIHLIFGQLALALVLFILCVVGMDSYSLRLDTRLKKFCSICMPFGIMAIGTMFYDSLKDIILIVSVMIEHWNM